jgi:hypothetical protein
MRWIALLLLLPFAANAYEYNNCRFTIGDDQTGVTYKIYLFKGDTAVREVDVGTDKRVDCERVLRSRDRGTFNSYVTAKNSVGESPESPRIFFDIGEAAGELPKSPFSYTIELR